jgi:uncharacterized membrane protein
METILAVYDTLESAQNAVNALVSAGFDRADIGLAARDVNDRVAKSVKGDHSPDDVDGAEGAGFGALVGGLTGLVLGLTAITIPGIGAIIAAGPIAAALGGATGAAIGATAGALTGGVTASLIDMGVPEEHAEYYAESVRRGSSLVSITVKDAGRTQRAMDILRAHQPVDVERRATQWKMKGWKGFDPKADPYTSVEMAEHAQHEEDEPVIHSYPYPHA